MADDEDTIWLRRKSHAFNLHLMPSDCERMERIADRIAELEAKRDQLRQQVADLQFEVLELKTINHTLMTNNR